LGSKKEPGLTRHGITFEDAIRIFDGPALEKVDDRFDYGEERVITLGLAHHGVLYVVSTEAGADMIRIISVRKAEPDEIARYDS